jgi:hypothetical protein
MPGRRRKLPRHCAQAASRSSSKSELRGGDAWDQRIRREIHDCALFIPVISVNTVSRREGYFRLEWDLADQRNHRMARETTEEGKKLEVED